jgi:hypothetical protein
MKSIKPFKILASRVAQSTLDQGTTGPGCKEVILVHIQADMRCFCSSDPTLFMVTLFIVLLEQILAEVAFKVAPHGMNVVGIVLRIIHFD